MEGVAGRVAARVYRTYYMAGRGIGLIQHGCYGGSVANRSRYISLCHYWGCRERFSAMVRTSLREAGQHGGWLDTRIRCRDNSHNGCAPGPDDARGNPAETLKTNKAGSVSGMGAEESYQSQSEFNSGNRSSAQAAVHRDLD
eukprot:824115-Prorocentrum_minimum.AAC.1